MTIAGYEFHWLINPSGLLHRVRNDGDCVGFESDDDTGNEHEIRRGGDITDRRKSGCVEHPSCGDAVVWEKRIVSGGRDGGAEIAG